MDTTYETSWENRPLKEKPSFYFKRQCWISGDPDETALALVSTTSRDRFSGRPIFPHFDHPRNYLKNFGRLVAPLSETARPWHSRR